MGPIPRSVPGGGGRLHLAVAAAAQHPSRPGPRRFRSEIGRDGRLRRPDAPGRLRPPGHDRMGPARAPSRRVHPARRHERAALPEAGPQVAARGQALGDALRRGPRPARSAAPRPPGPAHDHGPARPDLPHLLLVGDPAEPARAAGGILRRRALPPRELPHLGSARPGSHGPLGRIARLLSARRPVDRRFPRPHATGPAAERLDDPRRRAPGGPRHAPLR